MIVSSLDEEKKKYLGLLKTYILLVHFYSLKKDAVNVIFLHQPLMNAEVRRQKSWLDYILFRRKSDVLANNYISALLGEKKRLFQFPDEISIATSRPPVLSLEYTYITRSNLDTSREGFTEKIVLTRFENSCDSFIDVNVPQYK